MHEYAFDCKLFAAIRVQAETEDDARRILRETIAAADCNAGCWENGDPILFEASLDDGPQDLYEVDGETV